MPGSFLPQEISEIDKIKTVIQVWSVFIRKLFSGKFTHNYIKKCPEIHGALWVFLFVEKLFLVRAAMLHRKLAYIDIFHELVFNIFKVTSYAGVKQIIVAL